MPVKYVPYYPNAIDGQAILDNFVRTRRFLSYRGAGDVEERIRRGMPLYEVEEIEKVNGGGDNLVIRGECVSACAYLKEQGTKVDLVYIDPPFASGADYAKKIFLRRNPNAVESFREAAELDDDQLKSFEEKMYGDIWSKEDYLNWMFENLSAVRSILSDRGVVCVHLDWNVGHYVKVLLDEIFGQENLVNEVIWHYENKPQFGFMKHLPRDFDTLFLYANNFGEHTANQQMVPVKQVQQQAVVSWDPKLKKRVAKRDKNGDIIYEERTEKYMGSVWNIAAVHPIGSERLDYATQKPEALLDRLIKVSTNEGFVVADFFGGSGTTARAAHALGRRFITSDVGTNALQTTRDILLEKDAKFNVLDVSDGVMLFRNPVQTMDKLKDLIQGLRNEDSLDSFWEGAVEDSKLGLVPVYVPNLLDHSQKVLDKPAMRDIIVKAMPDLPDDVEKVIVYYIDIGDRAELEAFIDKQNETNIAIELRDLKEVLDNVVLGDVAAFEVNNVKAGFEVEITSFISDRLNQSIDEYNQKRRLQLEKKGLLELAEYGEIKGVDGVTITPLSVSDEGLELIEMVSLDCTNADGTWKSDSEIKIDKNSFVIRDGKKTKDHWDAKISSKKKPLRLKVRNIAGDETIYTI